VKAFELYGTIDLQSGKMQAGLKNASKQFSEFESKAKGHIRSVESAWSKLSNSNFSQGFLSGFGIQRGQGLDALAGGAAANLIGGAIQQGVEKMRDLSARGMEYYDVVQMTKLSFGTLLNDMQKGKELTADMLKFARITPFDDQPVLKYSQSLLAAKVQAKNLQTYLSGIGNALAGAGNFNVTAQEGTVRALTQMRGKPTLMSEELKGQLADHIPSAIADMAAALDVSVETLNKKMAAGEVKSIPAVDLLIDYWNKKYAGLMKFAGENTFVGLESSKRSAEAAMMANAFAGGDVLNPSAGAAGPIRLQALRDQIVRRDEMGKPGAVSDALGGLASAYLKARDKDDEVLFALTGSAARGGVGSIVTKTASKVSDNMAAPPGFFLGQSIGETVAPGWKGIPGADKLNPSFQDLGNGISSLGQWAKSLFTTATASAIDSVEQGKGPMNQAGATLGDSLITGMKSQKGLDSQSPSKRAIAEGLNVRLGLAQGLADPSINLSAAGAGLADEIFAGFRGTRGVTGVSERDYLEKVSQNPTVKAFFEAIKKAEGGAPDVMAGGRRVNSGPLHPGEVVPMSQWFRTSKGPSSASGDFQITRTNWRNLAPQLGLDNFSDEHQQFIAALKLFKDRGGLPSLLSGNIDAARNIAALDWTSTPGSKIGGGKQLSNSRWMGYFNQALGNGGSNTAQIASAATPVPVTIVDYGNGVDFRSGPSLYDYKDPGLQRQIDSARGMYAARRGPQAQIGTRTINDPVPVNVDVFGAAETLTTSFSAVSEQALILRKPIELLGESATAAAKNLGGLTEEEIAAKRAEALGDGNKKKKAKRDKLFDAALTKEGIAGDFQGNLQGMLGGDLWKGKFLKDHLLGGFLMPMLKDMQNRAGHDLSSMLTGALFGGRGEDGKLSGGLLSSLLGGLFGGGGGGKAGGTGGLLAGALGGSAGGGNSGGGFLSKLFGSLFGGFRASGGDTLAGRFYVAGERGPELIAGPGHVYNASQTQQMMSGGPSRQQFVFVDDERAAQEHYNASDRVLMYRIRRNQRRMARINRYA
jgi:tape measure domain-containing protein